MTTAERDEVETLKAALRKAMCLLDEVNADLAKHDEGAARTIFNHGLFHYAKHVAAVKAGYSDNFRMTHKALGWPSA